MLAAWEWGQLSGFAQRGQRIWLALLCGLLLAAMMLMLPEYRHGASLPVIEGTLWASLGWWIDRRVAAGLLLSVFRRFMAEITSLTPSLRCADDSAFFLGHDRFTQLAL